MIQVNDDIRIRFTENGYMFEKLKWTQVYRADSEDEVIRLVGELGLEDDFNKAVDELREKLRLMFSGDY